MRQQRVLWAKSGMTGLLGFAAVMIVLTGSTRAQSTDPSGLPLLSAEALQYLGGFRVPSETANGVDFSYGGGPLAFNPAGNSLFVGSNGRISEITIPDLVNSGDVNALPRAAYLQSFFDPTEGHLPEVGGGAYLSGLMVYGNRLYGTGTIYYDASYAQRVSHYSRALQLSQASFSGWSQVWESGRAGFVSGVMSIVPTEWQGRLGGPALTGQCCVPIITRTSFGPAAMAFNPSQVGQPVVPATPLLYYSGEHTTLGGWGGSNPTYGATTEVTGMAIIAGTRTVLYFGRNGLGPYCYGVGTTHPNLHGTQGPGGEHLCYDPVNSAQSPHAYPYRYQIWAYDLNDFASVKAGNKQPWEVVPYGVWPLSFPTPDDRVTIGGVGYDSERQILYVSQLRADQDVYAYRPVIHAFRVSAAGVPTPTVSTVSNVVITADKVAPQAPNTSVSFTATPSGGTAPHQYRWFVYDGAAWTPVGTWGTTNRFTWAPATANENYRVSVWTRSSGSTVDAPEAQTSVPFAITAPGGPATSVSLVPNRLPPQAPLTVVTWTATPQGGTKPHEYKWLVHDGSSWKVIANWSQLNTFPWTPSTANSKYKVGVWVRSAGNTNDAFEASAEMPFQIGTPGANVASPVSGVSLGANKVEPQPAGTAITWSAVPIGATASLVYKWFVFDGSAWTVVANWGAAATFAWSPTVANANYRVRVWVKAASNTADQAEAAAEKGFAISSPSLVTPGGKVTLTPDKPSPQAAGTMVVFTAQAGTGVGPHQYQFWVFDAQQWRAVNNWNNVNTLRWLRHTPGPYQVKVLTRSAGSTNPQGEATLTVHYVLK